MWIRDRANEGNESQEGQCENDKGKAKKCGNAKKDKTNNAKGNANNCGNNKKGNKDNKTRAAKEKIMLSGTWHCSV